MPTISAKVSWLIFGITFSDLPSFPKRASNKRVRANRFSAELKSWSTKSCLSLAVTTNEIRDK